ncbi:MAG: lycopene beta-cyclase CrtY [Novosphingobium sp.]|nr:lycopene beta-cyclase CrtY [Novosphingobium sp.]
MHKRDTDIAIIGGGLAGGLIALALAQLRPELRLLVVEQGGHFGGNHVWSFFASDIAAEDDWLVEPLVTARWDGYDVHFPGHSRSLATPYRSIASERLDAALRQALPAEALLTGVEVTGLSPDRAELADGRIIKAGAIIDARGASALPHMAGGWQKFTGQMLRLERPHGLVRPVVMDARVEQLDGYRFVYCLPFSDSEVFVEDTYYANGAELDVAALGRRIADYAGDRGWSIAEVTREETGVLPVIATGDFARFWPGGGATGAARAGTRAALLHPLTSYSLPDAVRFAVHLATLPDLSGAALAKASYAWARAHWGRGSFYRMLTKMLFGAARPEQRYRMLERFYRLPQPLIERFYSGRSTPADGLRILAGKPPVPIGAALASLAGMGRPLAALESAA